MDHDELAGTSITDATSEELDVAAHLEVGRVLIEKIFERKPLDELRALVVEENAPLWYQDELDGNSPLHAAAHIENKELVDLLLEHGAVWNAGMGSFFVIYSMNIDL